MKTEAPLDEAMLLELKGYVESIRLRSSPFSYVKSLTEYHALLKPGGRSVCPIYYDLETTGLEKETDIIQISAVCEKMQYNAFCVPARPISPGAAMVHRMFKTQEGGLARRGRGGVVEDLPTVPISKALSGFLEFVDKCAPEASHIPVLVAHNGHRFDAPIVCRHLARHVSQHDCVQTWNRAVLGDSLIGVKTSRVSFGYPDSDGSNSLHHLVKRHVAGLSYAAHDGLGDSRALQALVTKICREVGPENFLVGMQLICGSEKREMVSLQERADQCKATLVKSSRRNGTLQHKLLIPTVPKLLMDRFASAGMDKEVLATIAAKYGYPGIRATLDLNLMTSGRYMDEVEPIYNSHGSNPSRRDKMCDEISAKIINFFDQQRDSKSPLRMVQPKLAQ